MTATAVPYNGYGKHWESVLQVGEHYGSHILRKEVPCGDYTYGLARAVLHMEVSEVDSTSLG